MAVGIGAPQSTSGPSVGIAAVVPSSPKPAEGETCVPTTASMVLAARLASATRIPTRTASAASS